LLGAATLHLEGLVGQGAITQITENYRKLQRCTIPDFKVPDAPPEIVRSLVKNLSAPAGKREGSMKGDRPLDE